MSDSRQIRRMLAHFLVAYVFFAPCADNPEIHGWTSFPEPKRPSHTQREGLGWTILIFGYWWPPFPPLIENPLLLTLTLADTSFRFFSRETDFKKNIISCVSIWYLSASERGRRWWDERPEEFTKLCRHSGKGNPHTSRKAAEKTLFDRLQREQTKPVLRTGDADPRCGQWNRIPAWAS